MKTTLWLLPFAALLLAACSGGSSGFAGAGTGTPGGTVIPPVDPPANWLMTDQAIVTTGLEQQQPTLTDTFNGHVPLTNLGGAAVTRGYEFTTPSGRPLAFSVVAAEPENTGGVAFRIAHSQPVLTGGAESIFGEGLSIEAPGLGYAGNWWVASADGAAVVTVRGSVQRTQVLLFEVTTSAGVELIAIRLKVGPISHVNIAGSTLPGAAVLSRQTIFSSDADGFGLPAIAVSGDRYSVTAYDEDGAGTRTRRWLQCNAQTGAVTGGESVSVAPDTGSWRDQEIAALNNVLAIAYTGNNAVQVEISLDRGASFDAGVVLNESASSVMGQRLVQAEISAGYEIAVSYWRKNALGASELCLVRATPTGFDANATPTGYSFGAPVVLHTVALFCVPLVMDLEYSSGGDLVIGYGYNVIGSMSSDISYRLAICYAGGQSNDTLVDTETLAWGNDPSVALIGAGASMTVFYAYEMTSGIVLREFRNGGTGFGNVLSMGAPGGYLPSVHARMQGGVIRVDLLYLAPENFGMSLKRVHWDDFDGGFMTMQHSSLFESTSQTGGTPGPSGAGRLIQTAGWMGYDAVTSGDDVAIVLHTRTVDVYDQQGSQGAPPPPSSPPAYYGNPSLLPGMTGNVPAPNASHMNQLEVIVID